MNDLEKQIHKHSRWMKAPASVRNLAALCFVTLTVACQARNVIKVSEFPDQAGSVAQSISIVTWNAQKGQSDQFKPDLAKLIIVDKPDFVFIQEARADLLTTQRIGGYFASSWSYPWPNGKVIGLLTLSHIAPLRIQPMPSKYREFFVTAPKLSLATEYPMVNGQRLLTINVHLLAFERWTSTRFASQLDDLKTVMEEHTGPIILVGDFNTWSHKRLTLVEEAIGDLGLTEVTEFSPERRTADKDSSFLNWLFGIDEELPLDRVYYRGFAHHSAKVLPYDSSDHRALQVSFDIDSPTL
jgi:endonuclease/exonuclease/phosphatase (EEP) superfamily protein YafD